MQIQLQNHWNRRFKCKITEEEEEEAEDDEINQYKSLSRSKRCDIFKTSRGRLVHLIIDYLIQFCCLHRAREQRIVMNSCNWRLCSVVLCSEMSNIIRFCGFFFSIHSLICSCDHICAAQNVILKTTTTKNKRKWFCSWNRKIIMSSMMCDGIELFHFLFCSILWVRRHWKWSDVFSVLVLAWKIMETPRNDSRNS